MSVHAHGLAELVGGFVGKFMAVILRGVWTGARVASLCFQHSSILSDFVLASYHGLKLIWSLLDCFHRRRW